MQILIDIAMSCLMIAVLPQIYKTIKDRKNLKGINLGFVVLTIIGNILAVIWGLMYSQVSIAMLNALYLIWTSLTLFWMAINRR